MTWVNKAMVKLVWILAATALILCTSSFSLPASTYAKTPYESKTADECVYEKECVLSHLMMAMQSDPMKKEVTTEIDVRKWEEPIRFKVVSKIGDINIKSIDTWYNNLARATIQDISIEETENFLILFTNSIKAELEGSYGKIFRKVYGDDRVLKRYKKYKDVYDDKCHFVLLQDPKLDGAIYSYFAFIEAGHPDIQSCVKKLMYSGFGLAPIDRSPIFQDYDQYGPYSKLELLLVLISSQKHIRSSMSFEEIKDAFYQIYTPNFMKKVDESGVLNVN